MNQHNIWKHLSIATATALVITACGGGTPAAGTPTRLDPINDTTAPIITLNGANTVTFILGDTYIELGATALDDVDGNVDITIIGAVDMSTIGTYTITYSAIDAAGNTATSNRSIVVSNSDISILPDFVKPAVSIEPYSYGDKLIRVTEQSPNSKGVYYLESVDGAPQGLTPEETKIWQSIGNRPVDNKLFKPKYLSIYNSLTDNETTAWSKRDRGDLITYDLKVSEKVNRMELLSNYTNIYSIHGLEWHVKYENMKITEEYLDNVDMLTMMQIKQNTHKYQPLFMIRYGVRNFNTITRKKNKDLSVVFCTSIDSCNRASASFPLASGDDFKRIALSGATFYIGFKIREATEPQQYNLYKRFEEMGLYSEDTNESQKKHKAFPNWNEPSELEVDVYIYCPELETLITKTLQMPPIYNDWERRTYVTGGLYTDFNNNHLRDVSVNITGTNLVFDESAVNR